VTCNVTQLYCRQAIKSAKCRVFIRVFTHPKSVTIVKTPQW